MKTLSSTMAVLAMLIWIVPAADATQAQLSQPSLSCDAATQESIDIRFCAGATGAPAGFSIQWQTLADFQQHGWPSDSDCPLDADGNATCGTSFCKASFSGVPGCTTTYSLGANACLTVNIGDFLFDECGASSSCANKALQCNTDYVFRAFAHNVPRGLNKSAFSATITCRTDACGGGTVGCTWPQDCWATNGPEGCNIINFPPRPNLWPQSVMDDGMEIGGIHYTADQLCAIFHLHTTGDDGLPALAHQIVSAKLSIATGADPTEAQAALDAANLLINGKVIGVDSIPISNTSSLTNTLRSYNEGEIGPGTCVPCDPGGDD
jgi:hypothetical protein